MPTPSGKMNFKDKRARLTHRTHIEAFQIVKDKLNFKEFKFSEEVENKVNSIRNSLND